MSVNVRTVAPPYAGAAASAPRLTESGGAALAVYAGLPLIVAILYLNLSDIVARLTPIPSLLQPLILVLIAAVIAYREQLQPRAVAATPLVLMTLVYCTALLVASVSPVNPAAANARILEAVRGLVILLIVGSLGASWVAVRRTAGVIALCAALLAVLTLFQTVTGRFDIDFGGLARSERGHIYARVADVRAAGPVGDPNFYGQILVIAFPFAAFLGWKAPARRERILFLAATVLIAAGIALTYSRGALLSFAVVVALTVVSLKMRPTAVVAVLVLAVILAPSNLTQRLLSLGGGESAVKGIERDSSVDRRKLDAAVAVGMFDDHPFVGVGPGAFSHHYRHYANQAGSSATQYDLSNAQQVPHSLYLELAAETGMMGLVSFGAVLAAAFLMLRNARRNLIASGLRSEARIAAMLSIAITGYLLTSVFLHGAFQRYLWLLLGLSAAVTRLASRESAASGPPEAA
jgi:putative inorganic carbon (HCO3(-)) transporter